MRRPSSVSGRVQRKVPDVRRGSGLVNTSSVGMLARKRSPWTVVSSAAHHLPPRAMPTSSSVPGARSTIRSSASSLSQTARADSISTCRSQASAGSSSATRQNDARSAATWRVAAAGSSSGYTGAHQPSTGYATTQNRSALRCTSRR